MVDCCLMEKSGYFHIQVRILVPTKDIASKEEILQSKSSRLMFDEEVRTLPHFMQEAWFPKGHCFEGRDILE
eukprot:8340616-Ditylum_brightwellii.AAC.1